MTCDRTTPRARWATVIAVASPAGTALAGHPARAAADGRPLGQARYFLRHGGHWKADGWTLPPALDIEHNPHDARRPCFGLGRAAMVRWIRAFRDEGRRTTGRRPVIYTTTRRWNRCTGGNRAFGATHPLWLADYSDAVRPPAGWSYPTLRQYASHGPLPGDQDRWNGTLAQLTKFADG